MDSNIIKGVTGHRTDEAFQRYNKITSKDAATVMQKARQTTLALDKHTPITENINTDKILELIKNGLAEALKPMNKDIQDIKEVIDHIQANKATIKTENVDMIIGMVISLLQDDVALSAINNMLDTTGLLYSTSHVKTGVYYPIK